MRGFGRVAALIIILVLTQGIAPAIAADDGARQHHLAIQVDQNDPQVMDLTLKNAGSAAKYYKGQGDQVSIEIVAYGPGLHMLRADARANQS